MNAFLIITMSIGFLLYGGAASVYYYLNHQSSGVATTVTAPTTPAPTSPPEKENALTVEEIIKRRAVIDPWVQEWLRIKPDPPPSAYDPRLIELLNGRLRLAGYDWQITPENQGLIFANIIHAYAEGGSVGIRVEGSGHNIFIDSEVHDAQTGIIVQNADGTIMLRPKVYAPKPQR